MEQIPSPIQESLALLLAARRNTEGERPRVSDVYARYRQLIVPGRGTDCFDDRLDNLIGRRYFDTDDTRVDLSEYGHMFTNSLAELVAAEAGGETQFNRLTTLGMEKLQQVVGDLPQRYGSRGGDNFVYVVLLHNDVVRLRRFREANKARHPGRPALYVGMSSHKPQQRFRNHKQGHKSSRYVQKYGLCLLPELFGHLNPLDRHGAAAMEIDLAADLRSQGYGVMGVYEQQTTGAL